MASLHKLLSEEGFERKISRKTQKKVKFKEDSIALPIYICHDRRSFDSARQKPEKSLSHKGSSVNSSRKGGSGSDRSNTKSINEKSLRKDHEPAIDDIAIKAMISILNGYVGQYLRDKNFRESIRQKCYSCFVTENRHSHDFEIFAQMELGIQNIEKLVESRGVVKKHMDLESLQDSVKLLDAVAYMNVKNSEKNNSNISSCAHLYLSIIYKIAKNDRISARHLLQVFCDSPFLARTHLLPELWEHFFLPHLLHLKIWYTKELEFLSSSEYDDKEKKIKSLNQQYDDQIDKGTTQFAVYYKEWLKVGAKAPSVPSVPLPSKPSYARSRRRSLDSSTSYSSISNKSLYQAVFGPVMKERSVDMDNTNGALKNEWDMGGEENASSVDEDAKNYSHVEKKAMSRRRSSSRSYRTQKPELWTDQSKNTDYFRFLACRTEPIECLAQGNYLPNNENIKNEKITLSFQLNDVTRAIATICSSESLSDCETSIRLVSKSWLNSNGDPMIENSLSKSSVIQGIMEVLFVSQDDEILELAISILAELATKREMNRQFILNSDPRLEVSTRLLRSGSLFLKAAALLYLVKPKAKQMISMEWIPLVLRVLEFGDQVQTLLTVRCSPHEAAYYFLDELLTGFNEDRNVENAKQIISLGGLNLLARRMDEGDTFEKSKAVLVLNLCIKANGSCRHYLAKNLKKENILSLIVLGKETNSHGNALGLLMELLCLSRRNHRTEFLNELAKGWNCLNTMHILFLYLQKARIEERPIVAVILLLIDLMGNPSECSIYREEAIDSIIKSLDCRVFDEQIQQQSARALLIFGGHFSYSGEPEIEKWLLRKAGYDENSFYEKNTSINRGINLSEEDITRDSWHRKSAMVLLTSGNRRLFAALSDSICNSIPCLARASLVTICWISSGFHFLGDQDLQIAACSILVPQLIESLNYDKAIEERVLASSAILTLTKGTDYFSKLSGFDEDVLICLRQLCGVTWTAEELISLITSSLVEDQFS